MPVDHKTALLALLPAGEWQGVRLLNRPAGMMANRNWAIFAKARWLRHGGRDAFIKFIVPASPAAGLETKFVTGEARLKSLAARLAEIQRLGSAVPLVPILEVRLAPDGLLIAMEEVTPLQDLIDRGEGYALSGRVLRDLDPDLHAPGEWFHYDICPRNIGVTASGACVLTDVESFYLVSHGTFAVSVPAWKGFRVPRALAEEVEDLTAAGAFPPDAAAKKIRFEVALAAAECVLGPMPTDTSKNLEGGRLDKWLAGADQADPGVVFWAAELRKAVATGEMPRLRELADRLDTAVAGQSTPQRAPRVPVVAPEPHLQAVPPPAQPPKAQLTGWDMEWALLSPAAHALRAGRLDQHGLAAYREALMQLAGTYPGRSEVWEEILLILMAYEKDFLGAYQVAKSAVGALPHDRELKRRLQIVSLWVSERKA